MASSCSVREAARAVQLLGQVQGKQLYPGTAGAGKGAQSRDLRKAWQEQLFQLYLS